MRSFSKSHSGIGEYEHLWDVLIQQEVFYVTVNVNHEVQPPGRIHLSGKLFVDTIRSTIVSELARRTAFFSLKKKRGLANNGCY